MRKVADHVTASQRNQTVTKAAGTLEIENGAESRLPSGVIGAYGVVRCVEQKLQSHASDLVIACATPFAWMKPEAIQPLVGRHYNRAYDMERLIGMVRNTGAALTLSLAAEPNCYGGNGRQRPARNRVRSTTREGFTSSEIITPRRRLSKCGPDHNRITRATFILFSMV
ncbi:hypothetical protein CSOJ01_06280 [Colletotrichum sojae]|uniref:Uncharacterized protein n=1 Tax=Colletotrichum sojae TaxID=2175907 RepID=A0A8H6MW52_9PEZI|nr:hypothetical protein CSOJ01_06280 [Colletotrichum sojae]